MAEFITGEKLADEVYDIIFNAKKKLLIVSPYIKLDDYFKKELFDKHKSNPELHLIIVFGKNKKNPKKSFSKYDFDYFKGFPNVSIVYVDNLHAKYYANEEKGVVTSINLYDYSFKNNIEFGVISETKLIGGSKIDVQAWDSTMNVLAKNNAVFIKRPTYKKKMLFGKDYMGSDIKLDITDDLLNGKSLEKHNVFDFMQENYLHEEQHKQRVSRDEFENKKTENNNIVKSESSKDIKVSGKLLSATALGSLRGKSYDEVISVMTEKGFLSYKEITPEGAKVGITYNTNSKGHSWIVYPESIKELL